MKKLASRLSSQGVIFFNCDIQSLFNNPKYIYGIEGVLQSAMFMSEVENNYLLSMLFCFYQLATIFKIPVIVSEHNPKQFGNTVQELKQLLPKDHHIYEKNTFTMYNDDLKKILLPYEGRRSVVIYGIETHICVQQTCLELLQEGFHVHLVVDGVSSSKSLFRSTAIQKLQHAGVYLNSTQGIMFELLGSYKVPEFKETLKLVKKYQNDQILPHL